MSGGLFNLIANGPQDRCLTGNLNIDFFSIKRYDFSSSHQYQQLYLLMKEIFPDDIIQEIFKKIFRRHRKLEKIIKSIHSIFSSQVYMFRDSDIFNFIESRNDSCFICIKTYYSGQIPKTKPLNMIYHCLNINFERVVKCDKSECKDVHFKISKGAKKFW